jgi:hypothetical protein
MTMPMVDTSDISSGEVDVAVNSSCVSDAHGASPRGSQGRVWGAVTSISITGVGLVCSVRTGSGPALSAGSITKKKRREAVRGLQGAGLWFYRSGRWTDWPRCLESFVLVR